MTTEPTFFIPLCILTTEPTKFTVHLDDRADFFVFTVHLDDRAEFFSSLCNFDRKKPPPPRGFPIYYVPSSKTVSKRTPLEEFVPGASRGVLLLTVLDEGT